MHRRQGSRYQLVLGLPYAACRTTTHHGLWQVIEAFQKLGQPLPVNVKMCLEAMEESGSEVDFVHALRQFLTLVQGLDELVYKEAKKFFADVDYFCISFVLLLFTWGL